MHPLPRPFGQMRTTAPDMVTPQTITSRESRLRRGCAPFTPTRNRVAALLGALWIVDGLLQLQPYFFSGRFEGVLYENLMADPQLLERFLEAVYADMASLLPLSNICIIAIQVVLGGLIIVPKTRKTGILLSIPWSLVVWFFGENAGGILSSFTSPITGLFPGAVLLYAVLGLLVWPTARADSGPSIAATGMIPRRAVEWSWGLIFGLSALITLWSGFPGTVVLNMDWNMVGAGQPFGLQALLDGLSGAAVSTFGWMVVFACTAVCLIIGLAPLVSRTRAGFVVAWILLLVLWVLGQAFGGIFSGQGTDFSQAPLYALILLTLYPRGQIGEKASAGS